MRLEEAFSLQFGQTITAERAYELFWAGIINDKRAFRCPGDDCTAQVTCANLDALEQDLKVQPHYRPYGEHETGCTFAKIATTPSRSVGPRGHGFSIRDPETPDVFNLSRPANHFVRFTVETPPSPPGVRKPIPTRGGDQTDDGARQRQYYSVANLVSRWLRFRKESGVARSEVRIGAATLTYEQLFKGVYNQNAEILVQAQHVYWGKAWAKRLPNDTGYRIEFNEKMKVDGMPRRPSLLVYDNVIEKYSVKKPLIERLQAAIEKSDGGCILFVFGAPIIVPDFESATPTAPYTRSFINFRVNNLDMIDIQSLSLFEQLRST